MRGGVGVLVGRGIVCVVMLEVVLLLMLLLVVVVGFVTCVCLSVGRNGGLVVMAVAEVLMSVVVVYLTGLSDKLMVGVGWV